MNFITLYLIILYRSKILFFSIFFILSFFSTLFFYSQQDLYRINASIILPVNKILQSIESPQITATRITSSAKYVTTKINTFLIDNQTMRFSTLCKKNEIQNSIQLLSNLLRDLKTALDKSAKNKKDRKSVV